MTQPFSASDIAQIESLGLTVAAVEQQLHNFKVGFPRLTIIDAATVENGGIIRLDDKSIAKYIASYGRQSKKKKILKFVPASGAASRMFKELYAFTAAYYGVANNFEKEFPDVKVFLENIRGFAFYRDLEQCMKKHSADIAEYMERGDYPTVINMLLKEQYLGYGNLPKALLKFHKYGSVQRTPIEEHIVEGAEYAKSGTDQVNLHFTVSPEHLKLFRKKISQVKTYYESVLDVKLNITYSEQKHYTDTIAVDEYNEPIRDENGRLMFRPGGHGALIENLNECRADIVFIKNIDNVVPDWMKHTTTVYKQALAGLLIDTQNKVFHHIETLRHKTDEKQIKQIVGFIKKDLHIEIDEAFDSMTLKEKKDHLFSILNRPIRVCGMVKNQGEPGGGPFFVRNSHGIKSLQIVESAQVNRKDPEQEALFNRSTHFNPVDLVCGTKDYRNRYFDLRKFIDPETGFISKKSKGSQIVKSQELPGLWNGAMANWITLFVEVPLATFNPVKTVNDLLRNEHLEQ